jgi:hypothetical protein
MASRAVLGDVALPLAARGTGTFAGGPVAPAGEIQDVFLHVYCSAASGTTPTLNVSLEESDDGSTWTAIAGSAVPQLTAAGNAGGNATPAKKYVRATSVVAGTTPSFTYRVALTYLGE